MRIQLQQFPTLDQVLRVFAEDKDGEIYKNYRGDHQEMPKCHLTANGFKAYQDLVAFLTGVAVMSTGADGTSMEIPMSQVIENINEIICYGENLS